MGVLMIDNDRLITYLHGLGLMEPAVLGIEENVLSDTYTVLLQASIGTYALEGPSHAEEVEKLSRPKPARSFSTPTRTTPPSRDSASSRPRIRSSATRLSEIRSSATPSCGMRAPATSR